MDEGLLLDDLLAEGLELVLGLLGGEGPHDDLALVLVSAVLVGEPLLKEFFSIE